MQNAIRVPKLMLAGLALAALPAASASAQTYAQPQAIDPYAPPQGSYTYVMPAPQAGRTYPYVGPRQEMQVPHYYAYPHAPRATAKVVHRPANEVVDERPLPRKHKRLADEVDAPVKPRVAVKPAPLTRADITGSTGRVIRAEAEVTIIGPDRMSIRLFRKRNAGPAAQEPSEN